MSKHLSNRKRGFTLIIFLITILMVTAMSCSLLSSILGGDDEEPEEVVLQEEVEEPTVNEEIEEPVQEEVDEPVQEEEPAQEEAAPVQEQPATTISGDELYIIEGKQGVVKGEYYTYGVFVVGNPRSDCKYDGISYSYVAYDINNNELYSEEYGYMEVASPGGQVLEMIYFPEEATETDHFEVTSDPGSCSITDVSADTITVSNPMLIADEYYPGATAVVNNNLDDFQTDIFVGVLGYDASGNIVSVGSSYIDHIYPNDYTGVEVYMNTAEGTEIASLEFIPAHSYFSEIGMDMTFFETAYLADELPWIQIEDSYETVFYILNDNPTEAALDIEYRLTILDEANNVLSVESGWIDYVLPGDASPIYISASLPEGSVAYTHFVELSPGEFGESPFAENPFTTANYSIDETGWTPVVYFDLTNGSDKAVSGIEMVVILYDVDGNFIGGGYTSSDILSANSTVGQEVNVSVLGEADSVDVYLNVDYWTEIEGWGDN